MNDPFVSPSNDQKLKMKFDVIVPTLPDSLEKWTYEIVWLF